MKGKKKLLKNLQLLKNLTKLDVKLVNKVLTLSDRDKLCHLINFKNFLENKELDSEPKPRQMKRYMIYHRRKIKNSLLTLLLKIKRMITIEKLELQHLTEITHWS